MLTLLKVATAIWLAWWALLSLRGLSRGSRRAVLFVYPVHFVFCGVPLLLEVVFGPAAYERFPGFREATRNDTVTIIYCFYVAACPLIWWFVAEQKATARQQSAELARWFLGWLATPSRRRRQLLALVLVLPALLLLLAPEPGLYFEYTPHSRDLHSAESAKQFHAWLSKFVLLSMLAGAALIFGARSFRRGLIYTIPFMALGAWINGKRNAVALALLLVTYVAWRRRVFGRHLLPAAVVLGTAFLSYSIYYQVELRFPDEFARRKSFDYWLEGYRIDFGRDSTIRLSILHELDPHRPPLLEYRGQSLEFVLLAWLPRFIWSDKPISYATQLTNSAMGRSEERGGVTTSWLGEALSNFSWAGLVLGPLLIGFVCRLGDACRDETILLLTVLVTLYVQTVHFPPWALIGFLWFGLILWRWRSALVRSYQAPGRRRRPIMARPPSGAAWALDRAPPRTSGLGAEIRPVPRPLEDRSEA